VKLWTPTRNIWVPRRDAGFIGTIGAIAGGRRRTTVETDPYFSSVVLLAHMNGTGASFVDSSSYARTITAYGDATQSAEAAKFGAAGGTFDATGDLLLSTHASYAVGSGDFTCECFARANSVAAPRGVFHLADNGQPFNSNGFAIGTDTSPAASWRVYANGVGQNYGTYVINTWYHVALSRSGTALRFFVDGVQLANITDSQNKTQSTMIVAGFYSNTYLWNGQIDELRFTVGVARYTTNFTPPTAQFPDA